MSHLPARGEVWWCEMAEVGQRPVVLSRDGRSRECAETLVAPCTTNIRGVASEVALDPDADPISRSSAVNLDSIESVLVAVLVSRIGRPSDHRMREICPALNVAVVCSG